MPNPRSFRSDRAHHLVPTVSPWISLPSVMSSERRSGGGGEFITWGVTNLDVLTSSPLSHKLMTPLSYFRYWASSMTASQSRPTLTTLPGRYSLLSCSTCHGTGVLVGCVQGGFWAVRPGRTRVPYFKAHLVRRPSATSSFLLFSFIDLSISTSFGPALPVPRIVLSHCGPRWCRQKRGCRLRTRRRLSGCLRRVWSRWLDPGRCWPIFVWGRLSPRTRERCWARTSWGGGRSSRWWVSSCRRGRQLLLQNLLSPFLLHPSLSS